MCRIFGGPNLLSVFVVKEDFGLGLLLLFTRNETEDVTLATKELNRPRPWCLTLPAPHTHTYSEYVSLETLYLYELVREPYISMLWSGNMHTA